MADRSVAVRLKAEVGEYKRGLEDAAKAADGLAGKTEAAGKAVDRQAAAADKAAKANTAAAAGAKVGKDAAAEWQREEKRLSEALDEASGAAKKSASASVDQAEASARAGTAAADTARKTGSATSALNGLAQSARDNQAEWQTLGASFATVGATMGAGLGLATREAIRWESAWAGVQKTTDGSPEQMAALEGELRQLAQTLPSTHEEIAAVAEAAGQLGVAREDISAFTKTAIDLGETTNLSADEAATSLAQLMNVMGTAPEDVGRLGAALVELGNNGASTEAEILNLASYISGAGQLIGATESDVLALANTMASLGINAERGGGVMSRTLQDIYVATQNGGRQLEDFARVAGMSGAEFTQAFGEDPIRAVGAFTDGLAAAKANGDNVVDILNNLGIKGTQDTAVLLQMAGAQGMLTESLDMGNAAWEANSALVDEANKRYETTEARLQVARNQFNDAAIDLGVTFLPVLTAAAETVGGLASSFADLPQPVQTAVGGLGAVAAVTATAVGGAMLLIPRLLETRDAFTKLAPAGSRANEVISGVGRAAKYAGGIAAVAIAVNTLGDALSDDGVALEANALADAVERIGSGDLSKIDEQFRNFEEYIGGTDVDGLASAFERLYDPSGGQAFTDRLDKIAKGIDVLGVTGDTEVQRVTDRFTSLDQTLAQMAEGGDAAQAAAGFEAIAAEAANSGVTVEQLNALFPQYQDALLGAKASQDEAAGSAAALDAALNGATAAAGGVAVAATTLPTSFQGMVDMLGLADEAAKELEQQFVEAGESMLGFADPLSAYTTMLAQKTEADRVQAEAQAAASESQEDSWTDYVSVVTVSVDEYLAQLTRQVQDQTNWQTNMLRLAGRVSQGTLDELARMGPEGAPLVAELVGASDAKLREMETLFATRSENATFAWGEKIRLAGPVLAAIAAEAGEGAANAAAEELAAGTATIEEIAADYGVALANGVNPILKSIGKSEVKLNERTKRTSGDNRTYTGYADGGMWDSTIGAQQPQIQHNRGDRGIQWAETGSGPWEAFISGHPAKRERSLKILHDVAGRLGARDQFGEKYADGGIRQLESFANGGFTSSSAVPRVPSTAPAREPLSTAAQGVMARAREEIAQWVDGQVAAAAASAMGDVGGPVPSPGPGGWARPGRGGRVSSEFGMRFHPIRRVNRLHNGIDVAGLSGSRVLAAQSGRVRFSGSQGSYGNVVFIRHAGGTETGYAHLARRAVAAGDTVNRGQLVGIEGATGGVTGKHLHFNVRRGGSFVNPRSIIRFADGGIAKGGVLNPHIRDKGGPLLPGFTLNATGAAESVVPHASARAVAPAAMYGGSGVSGPLQLVGTLDLGNGLVGQMTAVATAVVDRRVTADQRTASNRAAYRTHVEG